MMVDRSKLLTTLKAIETYDESGKGIEMVNVVANLIFESLKGKTAGQYNRLLVLNNLRINVKYNL